MVCRNPIRIRYFDAHLARVAQRMMSTHPVSKSPLLTPSEPYPAPTSPNLAERPRPAISVQATSNDQYGGLAAMRQQVSHPPVLKSGMVSGCSIQWLNHYINSGHDGARALACAISQGIAEGSLQLGNPKAQSARRAQYGKCVEMPDGSATVLANFQPLKDGQFKLLNAYMRSAAGRIMIAPNRNGNRVAASAVSASSGPVAAAEHRPTANLSFPPSPSVVARPEFSKKVRKSIHRVVDQLPKWEQKAARDTIESKLGMTPEDQHTILLQQLIADLSGKRSDSKPTIICEWASKATLETAMAGWDLRSSSARTLEANLAKLRANPEFKHAFQAIVALMPDSQSRRLILQTTAIGNAYRSVLFNRVFRDPRGPLIAIKDILNRIKTLPAHRRYAEIKAFIPPGN